MASVSREAVMCLSPEICFRVGSNVQNTRLQMPVLRFVNQTHRSNIKTSLSTPTNLLAYGVLEYVPQNSCLR
jgi:hypothetical protein